jgi:ribosomal protein S18 acetylase RimI-like enzyme
MEIDRWAPHAFEKTAHGTKLERFAVLAENRGAGVGDALLRECLERLQKGTGSVFTCTRTSHEFLCKAWLCSRRRTFLRMRNPSL